MIVVIAEAAWADLFEIGQTVAEHSKSRAERLVDELYDRCLELGSMPRAFSVVPRHEESGIRRRVHRRYLIFYRIADDRVEVIHVLHGAMDYRAILFPEGDLPPP